MSVVGQDKAASLSAPPLARHWRSKLPGPGESLSLALAFVILILVGVFSYREWLQFRRESAEVQKTSEILRRTRALLSAVTDAETGQRGYLLTGEKNYLRPYDKAIISIPLELTVLKLLTSDDGPQSARVQEIESLSAEKLRDLKIALNVRDAQGLNAAIDRVRSDRGRTVMENLRLICGEVEDSVYDKFMDRSRMAEASRDRMRFLAVGGSVTLFLLLAIATGTITTGIARREQLIDELHDRERQIAEVRDLLRTTLSSIGDAVIATDAAGRVMFINGVAEELTGWRAEAAMGQPLVDVFRILDGRTGKPVEAPLEWFSRGGDSQRLRDQAILEARDGRRIPIEDSVSPLRHQGQEVGGMVLVFRDVTERRRQELEREEQAQALARSNADLERFAFAASHDLQEPLRMIRSYSQLLVRRYKDRLDNDANEFLAYIEDGTTRMTTLIEDLLAYSKVIHTPQRAVPVDLNVVASEALQNCRTAIEETQAVVNCGSLPRVEADGARLVQVFQNLISNALKYRRKDRAPKVEIGFSEQTGEWVFYVRDNGIGIPQQYRKQVFEMFRRLHRHEYPGTGIGLALCQRIIESYGGRMWIDGNSIDGGGSVFYFTLPKRRAMPQST
jgi:PAS domain S-box-containing protein